MQLTALDFRCAGPALALALVVATPARAAGQLELRPDLVTVTALIVTFVAITLALRPLVFDPLFRVMDARQERIEGARQRADHVERQADETLARYEESIDSAHGDAAAELRRQVAAAREELAELTGAAKRQAEGEIGNAREELAASVDDARDKLREAATDLATLAAERILGRSLAE